jgi:hypothetical protein
VAKTKTKRAPPSPAEVDDAVSALRAALDSRPILMLHDAALPSVTTLIAGAPIAGSWWGHPRGALVFEVLTRIEDEVAWPKLVRGKITLVHRSMWPELVAACHAEEAWQLRGLTREARDLLARVKEAGSTRTDRLRETLDGRVVGRAVDQLERRLLVMSEQVHTTSGKHARELSTWERWRHRAGIAASALPDASRARAAIGEAVATFPRGGAPLLPWDDAAP